MNFMVRGLLASALFLPMATMAQSIAMTNLGVANNTSNGHSVGKALNNISTVVGESGDTFPSPAFVWQNGGMTTPQPWSSSTVFVGVNDAGVITGSQIFPNSAGYAMIIQEGQTTSLGSLNGAGYSRATAINNANQVVGISAYTSGSVAPWHGFLWQNGNMTDLGNVTPKAINDAGVIVGFSGGDGRLQAVTIQNGITTTLGPVAGNAYASAQGINALGNVVGTSYAFQFGTYGQQLNRATLWVNGQAVNLIASADIVSQAIDINNQGQIIGNMAYRSLYGGTSTNRAFLWQEGNLFDLDQLISAAYQGWRVEDAIAINDLGQVLATGRFNNGLQQAILIDVSSIPELGSAWLMAWSMAVLLAWRARHKLTGRTQQKS